jgi:hypothetical protein
MKPGTLTFALALAATLQAAQNLDVVVNNNARIPLESLGPAEAFASRILATADVTVRWRLSMNAARKGSGRIVVLTLETNDGSARNNLKHALGYALPLEGVHASIFYDRIRGICVPSNERFVLAHAMAHEITHLLQGVTRHSETGVMKAHWNSRDISDMRSHLLPFAAEDIRMIRDRSERTNLSRLRLP